MTKELKDFVEGLAAAEVMPNVYNQYAYTCDENAIRRANLLVYLSQMYKIRPKVILVGEAPGYRGCRLTGVPFTSEHLLMNNMEKLSLFGKENGYLLAREKEKLLKEATATIIWRTLLEYDIMALAWNAFPFHPHKTGNAESNRAPLKQELLSGAKPLAAIIDMFNIKHVIAVGNKAEENLKYLGISCKKVRHPAQGGSNEFVKGIQAVKEQLKEGQYGNY